VCVLSFVLSVTTLSPRCFRPHPKDFPLNADMSAAPEIAQLASAATAYVPAQASGAPAPRPTIGALARELRLIASSPERWWGLVRFNSERSEKIGLELPGQKGFAAWVVALAPGDPGHYCDCDLMTLVTGEVAEESVADGGGVRTALRPGRTRVHGQGQVHQLRASGTGFAVTLHIRGDQPVS
jgi:hypothetical protein